LNGGAALARDIEAKNPRRPSFNNPLAMPQDSKKVLEDRGYVVKGAHMY